MAKYEYINGERRYYHKTIIWYDADKERWYLRLATSLQDKYGDVTRKCHITNVYFKTIAEAKRYIDEF